MAAPGADPAQRPPIQRFGTFELDLSSQELRKSGVLIKLQSQHFLLLALLAQRAGHVVTRDEIRETLWDSQTFVDFDRSINLGINQIRGALGDDPNDPRYIKTVPRKGYCFIAPVTGSGAVDASVEEACDQADPKLFGRDPLLSLHGGAAPTEAPREPAAASRRTAVVWIAVAAVLAAIAVAASWTAWRATRLIDRPLVRLSVDLGPEAMADVNLTVAVSPDGRRLVYPARGPDGKQLLAMRLLDRTQPAVLPGTEDGSYPFFSPDGEWIGFFSRSHLKKISIQGGAPVVLGDLSTTAIPVGASWGWDGTIVAAPANLLPLSRIPATGGPWQPLTKLASGNISHRWPQVLPGGSAVLFTASSSLAGQENANIEAVSLKTGQVKVVQRGGYYGRYLPSGHLVYVHQGALFGVRFDPARLEAHGAPVPLFQDVAANPSTGGGQFDFSSTGTFLYTAGRSAAQARQVALMDRSGKMQSLITTPGGYSYPRFSPDGKKLAFVNGGDMYVYDLERDTTSRLTFTSQASVPVWAPDGKHLVFFSAGSIFRVFWVRSDGSGEPLRLLQNQNIVVAWSFSSDGRTLAYRESNPETGQDLWTLPLDITDSDHPKPGKPEPFLRSPANENAPMFSPDARWIAYRSDESGNDEIYVRPFPATSGGRWQISADGGVYAFWSNNGRELFYETADNRIMVVDYTVSGDSFVSGKPRLWSDRKLFSAGTSNLDLAPDSKRFAVLALPEPSPREKGSVHVTMLLNFFDEVRRRIPVK